MYNFDELTALLDYFQELGTPSVDCIVYHKGECVYRHMDGFADEEKTVPISGKERYNIYSCSKPITCAAALQLYEKGLFRLDNPVSLYFPEFEHMTIQDENGLHPAKNAIRVKDLFTMCAGFTYDTQSKSMQQFREDTGGTCPTILFPKYLAQEPILFEPGSCFHYSFCHDVIGALVEKLSGQRFGAYVKEHIFNPLGMDSSTYALPEEEVETLAAQYTAEDGVHRNCGKHIYLYKLGSEFESGGAGCISTVEDYIKFAEAMRVGDVILKKETIDLMATDCLAQVDQRDYGWKIHGYGYGLGVRCSPAGQENLDFGWGGAAGAFLAIDRKREFTLFYAQHVLYSPMAPYRVKLAETVRRIMDRQ